jgi:hypothetical protein
MAKSPWGWLPTWQHHKIEEKKTFVLALYHIYILHLEPDLSKMCIANWWCIGMNVGMGNVLIGDKPNQ